MLTPVNNYYMIKRLSTIKLTYRSLIIEQYLQAYLFIPTEQILHFTIKILQYSYTYNKLWLNVSATNVSI
jgi:hypothetical protein